MNRIEVMEVVAQLRDRNRLDSMALRELGADTLLAMVAELADLERMVRMLADSQTIAKCRHVNFQVAKTGRSARVMVDDQEALTIVDAQHIEFSYDLAAARSADHHSFTAPPMRWGEPQE